MEKLAEKVAEKVAAQWSGRKKRIMNCDVTISCRWPYWPSNYRCFVTGASEADNELAFFTLFFGVVAGRLKNASIEDRG